MEIESKHHDWAVVHRLALMLAAGRDDFDVTFRYAVLCSLICWTAQRWRASDAKATLVQRVLRRESAFETRWIPLNKPHRDDRASLVGMNAECLLLCLRNTMAHGDERLVVPLNEGKTLYGFTLEIGVVRELDRYRPTRPGEKGERVKISLSSEDMLRIGQSLADVFLLNFDEGNYRAVAENQLRETRLRNRAA
jgi:hypothetical protein